MTSLRVTAFPNGFTTSVTVTNSAGPTVVPVVITTTAIALVPPPTSETATHTPSGGGGGLSEGAKAGIGAGVGVGVPVLVALSFLIFWLLRKRKNNASGEVQWSQIQLAPPVAAGGAMTEQKVEHQSSTHELN